MNGSTQQGGAPAPTRGKDLDGKVVLVTGGSRGIGRAVVMAAAAAGAKVAFCARALTPATGQVVREAEELTGAGGALAVAADVAREDAVEDLFDTVTDRFGQVDVVVNNAGINRDALLVQTPTEDFDAVIATNLTGVFLMCRRAVQEFLTQDGGGRIVSIGSISQRGATSQAAYAASKGGLAGLTRTIAKEYGHKDIVANLVTAGYIETDLTRGIDPRLRRALTDTSALRRAGRPEEVADVVVFLASARAGFINGEAVAATGGLGEAAL